MLSNSRLFPARLRRLALVGSVAVAAAAVCAVSASARPPQPFTFDSSSAGTDTTTCAFPVAYVIHEYGTGENFLAADGTPARTIVHVNADATISANGIT